MSAAVVPWDDEHPLSPGSAAYPAVQCRCGAVNCLVFRRGEIVCKDCAPLAGLGKVMEGLRKNP